jgi:hypothetical protein
MLIITKYRQYAEFLIKNTECNRISNINIANLPDPLNNILCVKTQN